VFPGGVKEIGWGRVALTADGEASCLAVLGSGDPVLHWHGDTFDLPDNAVRLASTADYENQAFAYGRCSLGLQFHLEADPNRLEERYVGHAVELATAKVSVPALRRDAAKVAEGLRQRAETVFGLWLAELD
jgi:GMP synthase (glutamine-hydrolysing)